MSSGQRETDEENWAGKSVSIECRESLGVYQGIISNCTPSEITIVRAFRNGVPLKIDDAVTLRSTDIIKISMLPSSFNNRNNVTSTIMRPSSGKQSNTVANNLANICQKPTALKHQQQQQEEQQQQMQEKMQCQQQQTHQHFARRQQLQHLQHQQELQQQLQQLQQQQQDEETMQQQQQKHLEDISSTILKRQMFNMGLNNDNTSYDNDTSNVGLLNVQKAIHVNKSPPSTSVVNFFSNLIPSKVENKLGANLSMAKIAPKASFPAKHTSTATTTTTMNVHTKTNIINNMGKNNNIEKDDNIIHNNTNCNQNSNPINNINNNNNCNNKTSISRDNNNKLIDDVDDSNLEKFDKQYQHQNSQQQNGIITITNTSLMNGYRTHHNANNITGNNHANNRSSNGSGNLISNSNDNDNCNDNGNGNGNSNGNGNDSGNVGANVNRQKARNKQQVRRDYFGKHSQTFGTSVDDPQMHEDFDFEGNLALFDKKAIWNSLESGKKLSLVQNAVPVQRKKKYRHDENVLESKPVEMRQIESFFGSNEDFVTDEGLIIPTVPIFVRNKIEKCAEKNGLSLQRQIDLLARGTTDLAMLLLGGARRLTPNNHHQWPIVVIICEKSDNFRDSNIGAATGRQIASHGLKVLLYLEEHKNIEQKSIEISLFKATDNSVVYSVEELPTPDLVILSSNSTNLSNDVKKWLSENRASILAVDPPPKGIYDVNIKYAILPILPLNGISSNNYGKLYLCNLSIPDKFYRDAGIKYKSPFGHKFVIPIHLKD